MDETLEHQKVAVRRRSAALFGGAQYRLEVCEALQSDETITVAGLINRLPVPPAKASVHMEVQRLIAAGLLLRLDPLPGDRHMYLRVVETTLWQAAREIAVAARTSSGAALAPDAAPVLRSPSEGLAR